MHLLSKPEDNITPIAPIVCVRSPDKIERQINSNMCDKYECELLRIDMGLMRADYHNWEAIFKESQLRLKHEIIMYEKALEVVLKLMEDSRVEADVSNNEKGIYVTISYKPTDYVYIRVSNEEDLRCFTLVKALDWIHQKIIDLKISSRKIENDQQFVNNQKEKINSIEKCLMKKEHFLAQRKIAVEKLNQMKASFSETPDPFLETTKDFETEFQEFMAEVEKDNALLSHMTDDILKLLNKLSNDRSANLTDSIVDRVRKEINELLTKLGEEKTQNKTTDSGETMININFTQNCSVHMDSTKNDSKKNYLTKNVCQKEVDHSIEKISIEINSTEKDSKIGLKNREDKSETEVKKNQTSIKITTTQTNLNKINWGDNLTILTDKSATNRDQKFLPQYINPNDRTTEEDKQPFEDHEIHKFVDDSTLRMTDLLSLRSLDCNEDDFCEEDSVASNASENGSNKIEFTHFATATQKEVQVPNLQKKVMENYTGIDRCREDTNNKIVCETPNSAHQEIVNTSPQEMTDLLADPIFDCTKRDGHFTECNKKVSTSDLSLNMDLSPDKLSKYVDDYLAQMTLLLPDRKLPSDAESEDCFQVNEEGADDDITLTNSRKNNDNEAFDICLLTEKQNFSDTESN
ncbi:uncharacterized protein LOC108033407 [Drosophila biarmipes]|uniref:uncharacterized protein LOC108033407 n=1 Tax=Drosophila biarmipes TaxID=125945 RepID=UPI0007E64742|nr:uncharacterized protein LOC108033407 [Drosophila biarmipes]